MLDPLTNQIIAKVFIEVFKTTFQSISGTTKWLAVKGKENDILGIAARRYAKKLENRYNIIRIFGMDKPVSLRSIYVRVNILSKITSNLRVSIKDLEKQFNKEKRSFGIRHQTRNGIEVANEFEKFIVLGKPGAGKTTFLKYLTLQTLDGNTQKKRIPIFISLKDFSDSKKTLLNFIVKQFDICDFPDAKPFIIKILEQGKCQVLIDGLDEVDKLKENDIIKQIRDFTEKYNENQFILSCRVAAYNHWFDTFVDVEMADFNEEQIKVFIFNWFKDEKNVAEHCLDKLNSNPQIKELASIPLLLTLLCLAFDQTMDFPQNRAELYKESIDALLKKWDATRRINRGEIYRNLSLKRKESMFSRIAAEAFEESKYFIAQSALEKKIFNFIKHLQDIDENTLEPDSEAILKAIEAQHGIFVQRAKGIYSFSHLTFQEYYTARYIVDNAKKGTLEKLVENYLTDKRWREVFLLTTSMLDEADDFLLLIKDEISTMASKKKLAKFIHVANEISSSNPEYPSAIKRMIAIIYQSNYVLDFNLDYDNNRQLVTEIANFIVKSLDVQFDFEFFINLIRVRDRIIQKGRRNEELSNNIDRVIKSQIDNIIDLDANTQLNDKVPVTAYKGYLHANKLLIDCLNTECYVSKPIRQKILNELIVF